jgi:nucleotide-binding universal stress UspA family protein
MAVLIFLKCLDPRKIPILGQAPGVSSQDVPCLKKTTKRLTVKVIHKIIVPIDFLQHTEQLAEYAVYIGEKFNAGLVFLHVIEPPHYYGDYEYPSLGLYAAEMAEHVDEKMKQFIEKYSNSSASCEGQVLRGNIADSIIKYAKDKDADLIIIGTHGRKGLEKMWLGSVAELVIKRSPCPTLTCNPYK